jgi:hypothetical protein
MSLFGRRSSPPAFWQWLAANTGRIQSTPRPRMASVMGEVSAAFKKSFPTPVWEITPATSPPWVFCVSADGDRAAFPAVEAAVRAAPPIAGWVIQRFRARGSLTAAIDMGGRKLGSDDIWCGVRPQPGGIDLTLHIRGLTSENDQALGGAAVLLLDNAIGEYDAVMKVRQLHRAPLPALNPVQTSAFFPLAQLPAFLDRIK